MASGTNTVTVTWTTALPDTGYRVQIQPATTITSGGWMNATVCVYWAITGKTTSSFVATLLRCNNSAAQSVKTATTIDWITIADNL